MPFEFTYPEIRVPVADYAGLLSGTNPEAWQQPSYRVVRFIKELWRDINGVARVVYRCNECNRLFHVQTSGVELHHTCTEPRNR
jgi:hypothetical protein